MSDIPIKNGEVIGTVNILDEAGHFSPQRVNACLDIVASKQDELILAMSRCPT